MRQGHVETEHRTESKPDLLPPIHSNENTTEDILKSVVGQRSGTGNGISHSLMPNVKEEKTLGNDLLGQVGTEHMIESKQPNHSNENTSDNIPEPSDPSTSAFILCD